MGAFRKICARFGLSAIKNQSFVRMSLSFDTPGLYVLIMTHGRMFLDVFGLYFKALFRDENLISACILLRSSCGYSRVRVGGI